MSGFAKKTFITIGVFVVALSGIFYFKLNNSANNTCHVNISKKQIEVISTISRIMNGKTGSKGIKKNLYLAGIAEQDGYSTRSKSVVQWGNFLLRNLYAKHKAQIQKAIKAHLLTMQEIKTSAYMAALVHIFVQQKILAAKGYPNLAVQGKVDYFLKKSESKCPMIINP